MQRESRMDSAARARWPSAAVEALAFQTPPQFQRWWVVTVYILALRIAQRGSRDESQAQQLPSLPKPGDPPGSLVLVELVQARCLAPWLQEILQQSQRQLAMQDARGLFAVSLAHQQSAAEASRPPHCLAPAPMPPLCYSAYTVIEWRVSGCALRGPEIDLVCEQTHRSPGVNMHNKEKLQTKNNHKTHP